MVKDYTAIRVEESAKEAAEAAKQEGETWSDYIQRCTTNPPEITEFVEADAVHNLRDELHVAIQSSAGDVATTEDIAELVDAVKEATNAAQSADRKLEELR